MKKGNKKVLVVALLLLLISVSFTTYAIYKSSVSATGSVEAAAWSIQFKDGDTTITDSSTLTFSASDCDNDHVADGKIAPGATCSKEITLVATGSEVDVAYEVEAGTVTATKGGTAVTTTGANPITASVTDGGDGVLEYANTMTTTLTVTIEWAGEDSDTTINPADTALAGATFSVPLTLTAKQYLGS